MTLNDRTTWRVLDVVISLLLTVVTGLIGWNLKITITHTRQIAEIQADRFTAEDGLEVWKEISAIRENIAKMPAEIPPPWLVREVADLRSTIRDMDARLRQVETKQ